MTLTSGARVTAPLARIAATPRATQAATALGFDDGELLVNGGCHRDLCGQPGSQQAAGEHTPNGVDEKSLLSVTPDEQEAALADAEAANQRGWEKLKKGQHKKALEDFDHAIECDESCAAAHNNRGIAKEILTPKTIMIMQMP
eukprot:s119_g48.t1